MGLTTSEQTTGLSLKVYQWQLLLKNFPMGKINEVFISRTFLLCSIQQDEAISQHYIKKLPYFKTM